MSMKRSAAFFRFFAHTGLIRLSRSPRCILLLGPIVLGLAIGLLVRGLDRPAPMAVAGLDHPAALAEDLQALFAGVADAVRPAVVYVSFTKTVKVTKESLLTGDVDPIDIGRGQREMRQRSLGSGVIIDRRGYILTNGHVVGDSEDLSVKLWDGQILPARFIQKDEGADVALIKINGRDLQELPLGNSDDLKVGHWVLAIGSPFGLTQTVSAGIVSAVGRSGLGLLPYENFIQTDASINQGNSGGPLVDLRGRLVGINTAIFSNSAGMTIGIGFAVPINMAGALVQKWIHGRTSNYLGIRVARLDRDAARYFNLEKAQGALVDAVIVGSPADRGRIQEKDLILAFNGTEIQDESHFRLLMAQAEAGKPIGVEVLRLKGGTRPDRLSLQITLTDGDLAAAREEAPVLAEPAPRTRMLGITVVAVTYEVARHLQLADGTTGMAVIDVDPNSPADLKGLRDGDIISEVNGRPVKDMDDLKAAMESRGKQADGSDVVMLRIQRGGENLGYRFLPR